MGVQIQADSK